MQNLHSRYFFLAAGLRATTDARGYLCELSPAWVTTLGFSLDELRSQPLLDFVHPEDHDATQRATEQLICGAAHVLLENRCLCRDGSHKRLRWLCRFSRQAGLILACACPVADALDAVEAELLPAKPTEAAEATPESGAAPRASAQTARIEPLISRQGDRSSPPLDSGSCAAVLTAT